VGLRDPRYAYAADRDFWLRLSLAGPLAHLPRTLVAYRVHPAAASVVNAGAMAREVAEIYERLFADFDLPPAVAALRRPALSEALAMAGTAAHRSSFALANACYRRSIRMDPLAWARCPPRTLLGRLARMLLPHALLEPVLAALRPRAGAAGLDPVEGTEEIARGRHRRSCRSQA
jgi:hypothetical protein